MLGLFACPKEESPKPLAPQTKPLFLLVTRVIDGDTIVLEDETQVRYIGIDTPGKGKSFYREATEMNQRLVEGKEVRLEYDVERKERTNEWKLKIFGEPRTLAYVYLGDGTFVNAWLVKYGFAKVMTVKPNVQHKDLFLELERNARENKLGLWQK